VEPRHQSGRPAILKVDRTWTRCKPPDKPIPAATAGKCLDRRLGLDITLDNFGRTAEQKWTNASGTTIDDFSYLYDQDGNALLRRDGVNSDQSQLYQYDGLNRLVSYDQGVVDDQGDDIPGDDTASGSWQLDALGNWKNGRTNNAQNQATTVGTATLSYDANGNTTADQSGQQYLYDAWNRLVAVKNASGQTIASYGYDALGRRITQTENGTATDLYYSTNWQVVEERQGSTTTAQYVWSPFYEDQLVERDDQPNGSGTLTRRLYAEQDADYNVTSITDSSGNVAERYSYDPYGNVTVENADGTIKGNGTASASGYGWTVLHQGLMLDSATGTYDDRNREFGATLGRFLQEDPAGYVDGVNRYQFVSSCPTSKLDFSGCDWVSDNGPIFIMAGGAVIGAVGGIWLPPGPAFWGVVGFGMGGVFANWLTDGRFFGGDWPPAPPPPFVPHTFPPSQQTQPGKQPTSQPSSPTTEPSSRPPTADDGQGDEPDDNSGPDGGTSPWVNPFTQPGPSVQPTPPPGPPPSNPPVPTSQPSTPSGSNGSEPPPNDQQFWQQYLRSLWEHGKGPR
jgi:RHS repeat-associated protein